MTGHSWPRLPFLRRQHLRPVERHAVEGCGKAKISGRYHHLPKRVEDDYEVLPTVLGRGAAGAVHLGRSLFTQREVAVKVFSLPLVACLRTNPAQRLAFANEVEIALSMDHPHVGRLLAVYESERKLHMIMEYLRGGMLLDHMKEGQPPCSRKTRCFPEGEAAEIASQMLLAVNYMHSHGIVHRDLKPGNFVYEGAREGSARGDIKLIDFGFSGHWKPGVMMSATVGTAGYVAPEVLDHGYTSQCDLWSFGVIVFRLLLGQMPFDSESREEERQRIRAGNFLVPSAEQWWKLSHDARDFLKQLLQVDPAARLTAEEAVQHPWITTRAGSRAAPSPERRLGPDIVRALQDYAQSSHLERACRVLIAWSTETHDRNDVGAAFEAIDRNCDGKICLDELEEALWREAKVTRAECAKIFRALDVSQKKEVEYSEFVAAVVSHDVLLSERSLQAVFRTLDADDHRFITAADLRSALGDSVEGVPMEELLAEAASNLDGRMSYLDLVLFFRARLTNGPAAALPGRIPEFVS